MAKMWAGVTDGTTAQIADDFNSSIRFDCRLYKQDIAGMDCLICKSLAYVLALATYSQNVYIVSGAEFDLLDCLVDYRCRWHDHNFSNSNIVEVEVVVVVVGDECQFVVVYELSYLLLGARNVKCVVDVESGVGICGLLHNCLCQEVALSAFDSAHFNDVEAVYIPDVQFANNLSCSQRVGIDLYFM